MDTIQQTFVYVFDYSVGSIFYIDITDRPDDLIEDILYEYGYQPDVCSWMVLHERITTIKRIK